MGQFKPMVKMMTTEPSVELKLKKGGSVKRADGGMMGATPPAPMAAMPARGGMPSAATPMAPSLAARRRAMRKMGAGPSAPVGLAASRMMKEGGKSDKMQDKAMIKKAFKQHDMQEHKGGKGTKLALKKGGMMGGGSMHMMPDGKMMKNSAMKHGGMASGGMTMVEKNGKMVPDFAADGKGKMKQGGMACATGGVIKGNGGGYKAGGAMKKMATGGVVKGQGGYAMGGRIPSESMSGTPATTMMDTARYDNSPATTGGVRNGNAGGFKRGGATKKHFATGGSVNSAGSAVAMPQGRKPASPPVKTNQVSGTYKKGGKVAPGNKQLQAVNKIENATAMRQAKMDSNLKYGPANKLKLAEGGSPSDMEKISKYISVYGNDENSKSMMDKVKSARYVPKENPKDISDKASRELEEALNPLSMVKELYNKARGAFGGQGSVTDAERNAIKRMIDKGVGVSGMDFTELEQAQRQMGRGQGSVTERERSVTVSPGKKRGGSVC